MKPYNKNAKCPKCNFEHIKTEYIPSHINLLYYKIDMPVNKEDYKIKEHILRTCCNCGYSWKEKPLDKDS
jgi:hypothetical protein